MALLRDADGRFRIPGSSIAGVCRSHLARAMMGSDYFTGSLQPEVLRRFFGGEYESLLTVFDAKLVPTANGLAAASRRDGVRLDSKTRTAADKAKFDLDVLPAGTKFSFQFHLRIREIDEQLEARLKAALRSMLEALQDGEIRIGARTRKGLGRGRVAKWQISCLDMTKKEHVEAHLKQRWLNGTPCEGLDGFSAGKLGDKRRMFRLTAALHIKTSVLIRASGLGLRSPDMVHLTEGGRPLLSGSAIGGAMRHRVEKIANTTLDPVAAEAAVVRLFGPIHEADRGRGAELHSGRVTVEEAMLENGDYYAQGRVALDRAFQRPIDGALFDEAAYWPKDDERSVNWRFELTADLTPYVEKDEESRDVRLLALAFKDLVTGDLPVGGETGTGRGVSAAVEASMQHADVLNTLAFSLNEGGRLQVFSESLEEWKRVLDGN
jgi:CRISPR/Cas system CSM-associated protein Csm3 (group 7 of RAMP superfamily)